MRADLRLNGLITLTGGATLALDATYALLDAVGRERSVRGAAERLGVSYRAAWGRIAALEVAVGGRPLVAKTKGHGSALTEAGAALRDALGAVLDGFEAPLAQAGQALARELSALLAVDAPPRRFALAVSHDPLLLDAVGTLEKGSGIDVVVVGSAEAAARLRAGLADLAGLHGGEGGPALEASLAGEGFGVEPLLRREQGMLLAPGNPLGIGSVADLAARGARFVNRQRGSGTRLWFDRLLDQAGVPPGAVAGYGSEEFTHQAVAALVASGVVDAGFGLRAAAERFGLAFASAGWETYYLAGRGDVLEAGPVRALVAEVRTRAGGVPGYNVP